LQERDELTELWKRAVEEIEELKDAVNKQSIAQRFDKNQVFASNATKIARAQF
jgi:hypothetical protein